MFSETRYAMNGDVRVDNDGQCTVPDKNANNVPAPPGKVVCSTAAFIERAADPNSVFGDPGMGGAPLAAPTL
jgi:hypothetical protein